MHLLFHLALEYNKRLGRDKHSSLLRKSVNYGVKKFYRIGPSGVNAFKPFTAVIYNSKPIGVGAPLSCAGVIHLKESGIQVLAGLAPSSQTEGSLFRPIHGQAKHSS